MSIVELADMTNPAVVMATLASIENDLATRQNGYEAAANAWFAARREQGRDYAIALLRAAGPSVTEKKAEADLAAYATEGAEFEAEFEAIRSVLKVLESRATICMSILKAQGRA